MTDKMSICIASDQVREDVFAELSYNDEQWAEVEIERPSGKLIVRIFPARSGRPYVFELEELQAILERAKYELVADEVAAPTR